MKIRLYENSAALLFPLYPLTVAASFIQEPIANGNGANFHQIFTVVRGSGMLRLKNDIYDIKKGDMFFIPKWVSHEYRGYSDDFTTCFLGFDGSGCMGLFEYFGIPESGFCRGKITPFIYSEFKEIYRVMTSAGEAKLCAAAYGLVTDFFEEALKKELSPLDAVLNYMEENYFMQLTLDDIISVYPYSKSKLCRDFCEKYSVTIFEKLTDIRLKHAYFLIENQPEMKIKTIAERCGYTDASYFCRTFKRVYGKSPDSLRKAKDIGANRPMSDMF